MSEEQKPVEATEEAKETIEVPQEYADERPKWLPEKFNTPEDLANSYTSLESKIGQKEEDIRNSVMKEMEEKAFSERPSTSDDYILPDSIDLDEAADNKLLNWWAEHSYENGFSQDEFTKGIEAFRESMDDGYNSDEEVKQLGDNAEERIEAVGLFVNQNFPEEIRDAVDNLCATANGIKAMEIIMSNMKQTTVNGSSSPTATLSEDKLREMMNDPRYYNPTQRDTGFVKMVDDGFKKMYNR
tara:strand:- start:507 stop:1232 length:726 start_codon:yes stop_codon:yes gene_type:complete